MEHITIGRVRSMRITGRGGSKTTLTITSSSDYSIKLLGSNARLNVFADAKGGGVRLLDEKHEIKVTDQKLIDVLTKAHDSSRLLVFRVDIRNAKLLSIEFPPNPSG
jgi:hypothetical protein